MVLPCSRFRSTCSWSPRRRPFNSPLFSRQRSHSPWFRDCGESPPRRRCCASVPAVSPACRSGCFLSSTPTDCWSGSWRSRDPRLWCDDGGVPASRGPPLGTLWQNRRSRSRRRGVAGVATALVGMAGPPVLIYPLLAGTAAQTVRATLLAFFALSYGATLASHAATVGIPGPPGWRPASLCPLLCWVALSVGRSATAWVATALPCWRSRCSPPPGFIRWRPRVSVF